MLLELLEHPQDIRKMTIMGRTCSIRKEDGSVECSVPLDKQSAEGIRLFLTIGEQMRVASSLQCLW